MIILHTLEKFRENGLSHITTMNYLILLFLQTCESQFWQFSHCGWCILNLNRPVFFLSPGNPEKMIVTQRDGHK